MTKRKAFIMAVALFCVAVPLIMFSLASQTKKEKPVTYQVTCVDDVLTGIVVKKGDRYYRQGGIDSVWIPMQQCALEPIK